MMILENKEKSLEIGSTDNVPKGHVTFRLVASGYRDNQDKTG